MRVSTSAPCLIDHGECDMFKLRKGEGVDVCLFVMDLLWLRQRIEVGSKRRGILAIQAFRDVANRLDDVIPHRRGFRRRAFPDFGISWCVDAPGTPRQKALQMLRIKEIIP
jgi:hypothetical protein